MKLHLPFEYSIGGVIRPGNNRTFVMVTRDDDKAACTPFVTYEVFGPAYDIADGPLSCGNGHYMTSRFEALSDLIVRAKLSSVEWREHQRLGWRTVET